jgi:formimidoylglutamate deiminase
VNLSDLVDANVDVCIGTDQHARIDVVDELRSLEDHERLRTERRCILVPEGGRLAHRLMPAGTVAGARALGVDVGRLAAGAVADLVAVRVPLEGRADDAVVGLDAWLVGGSSHDVTDVWIAGRHVIRAGAHEAARDIERAAVDVLRSL